MNHDRALAALEKRNQILNAALDALAQGVFGMWHLCPRCGEGYMRWHVCGVQR